MELNAILYDQKLFSDVENLDVLKNEKISKLLEERTPIADSRLRDFLNNAQLQKEHKEWIYRDMLVAFVGEYVAPFDDIDWITVCECFLGEKITQIPDTFSEKLTLLFLSFTIISPRFSTLTAFVRSEASCVNIKPMIETAVQSYLSDKSEIFLDHLVRNICRNYIWTDTSVTSIEEIMKDVPVVLTYCARLSCFPPEIHFLKVCADLIKYAPDLFRTFYVSTQAFLNACDAKSCSISEDDVSDPGSNEQSDEGDVQDLLNRTEIYHAFRKCLQPLLQKKEQSRYQQLMCLYFRRSYDADEHFPMFKPFLDELWCLPEPNMQFVGPILKTFVLELFEDYNVIADCCNEQFQWNGLYNILDEYIKSKPPNSVLNLLCDTLCFELDRKSMDSEDTTKNAVDIWNGIDYLKTATNLISATDIANTGLKYVLCAAYCKVFIGKLTLYLKGSSHAEEKLYQKNEIDQYLTSRSFNHHFGFSSEAQIFFVKSLHKGTLQQRRNVIEQLASIFPRLKDIKWPSKDDFKEQSIGLKDECMPCQKINIIGDLKKFEEECLPFLARCRDDSQTLYTFLMAIADKLFWSKFIDTTLDTNRQWADMLSRNISRFLKHEQLLFNHLSGKQDFKHKSMQLCTQSTDTQFYQAHVIFTAMIAITQLKHDSDNYAAKLFFRPEECLKDEITIKRDEFNLETMSEAAITYTCKCDVKTVSFIHKTNCSVCSAAFVECDRMIKRPTQPSQKVTIKEFAENKRRLGMPADEITQIILQCIFMASVNLGSSN